MVTFGFPIHFLHFLLLLSRLGYSTKCLGDLLNNDLLIVKEASYLSTFWWVGGWFREVALMKVAAHFNVEMKPNAFLS